MDMFTAEMIQELRVSLGLTITEFAFRLGVSASTVASWECNRRHPTYRRMVKLNDLAKKAGLVSENGKRAAVVK